MSTVTTMAVIAAICTCPTDCGAPAGERQPTDQGKPTVMTIQAERPGNAAGACCEVPSPPCCGAAIPGEAAYNTPPVVRLIATLLRAYPAVYAAIHDRLEAASENVTSAEPAGGKTVACCAAEAATSAARQLRRNSVAAAVQPAGCCDECCPGCCENVGECCSGCCHETKAVEKPVQNEDPPLCCGTTPEPCCGRSAKTETRKPQRGAACCGG